MRYSSLQNGFLISLLALGVAALSGCSSGTDSPATSAGGTGGTTGSGGTGGTTSSGGSGGTGGTDGTTGSGGAGTTGSGGTGGAGGGSGGTTGGSGGASGAGGSAGSDGGAEPPSVCDGKGTRPLALGDSKVDNFEGAAVSPGWSSFNDVMPTPNAFKIMQMAGGAVGTANSGHYAGMGAKTAAKGGFGVGLIYNNAIDVTAATYCVDITAFDGVTFWAKPGAVGSKVNVNFVLPSTNAKSTDPTIGGGDCTASCYNHPYKTVTLDSADWKQYWVTFAEAAGGSAKVKNVIQELGWLSPDADWDFSLDEIQFYKGTPPTGPAGARADR
ncbi:MAG TPA: hypothetical protein VK550_10295 [Polyangiaceae bacterium]|nr:hypothetical protein [Polyangiaceae bacterium]